MHPGYWAMTAENTEHEEIMHQNTLANTLTNHQVYSPFGFM